MGLERNRFLALLSFPIILFFNYQLHSFERKPVDSSLVTFVHYQGTKATVDSLNKESRKYVDSDSSKSIQFALQALEIANSLGYIDGVATSHRRLGYVYLKYGDLVKAKRHYQFNLDYRKRDEDTIKLADAHFVISQVTRRMGDKVATLDNLLAALSLLDNSEKTTGLTKVLDGLGNYYRMDQDYKLADEYYNRALSIRLSNLDSIGIIRSYQVLGNLQAAMDNDELAKSNYLLALGYAVGPNHDRFQSGLLTNLGNLFYRSSILDSAELFYQKALKIRQESGNAYSQALLLNNLTALAFERKTYRKSVNYAEEGVALAKEVGSPELLSSLYYNLSDSYKALGDYKRSFEYYKLSDSIDYEITNTEKNAQLAELQVKFDTEKKDREIAEKTLELTEASIEQKQLLAGLVFLLLVAGFIYWSLLRKKKSNKLLQSKKELIEKREQEKALLLRELHHRVKNNFQVVSSLLNLQYYEAESHTAAEAIKAGQTRVEAMSMIHRELYQGENDTALEMKDYVVHLIENAIYLYDFEPEAVDLDLDIDDSPLDVKYAIPLGIIINELITNAFKHAFQAVARPALRVYLNMDKASQKLTLTVGDNGPGLPHTGEVKASSFGLELIGDLMKQLKGKMTTDNQSGAEFTIVFPYIPLSAHVEG